MNAPPGISATTQPATSRVMESQEHLSPRIVTREAAKVCADLNLNIRGARLRVLVDRYLTSGRSDLDFRTWFIGYADPTGEAAVRNVMRGA